jgi:ABC-type phosphate/phosphonate transport system substrate-binding protein
MRATVVIWPNLAVNFVLTDGSRSGYAYELLQDIAQYENVTFAYSCLNGNNQQAMQQLAAGQIDLIPVLRRIAERDELSMPTIPTPTRPSARSLTTRATSCARC